MREFYIGISLGIVDRDVARNNYIISVSYYHEPKIVRNLPGVYHFMTESANMFVDIVR